MSRTLKFTWRLAESLLLTSLLSFSVYAKPFVEKVERFEWDWSNMKLRFYGESGAAKPGQTYPDLRKIALQEGLLAARKGVHDYHHRHLLGLDVDAALSAQSAQAAGDRTAAATWTLRSEFYSLPDKKVRVYMESSLARALHKQDLIFSQEEAPEASPSAPFSGLVLRSTAPVAPMAIYRLVDEEGKVLFSVRDVAGSAYRRNLMGRWFVNPNRAELSRAVGPRPISLEVAPGKGGNFVVQRSAWNEAMPENKALLERSRIAIALPGQPPASN